MPIDARARYRLQLRPGFGFDHAAQLGRLFVLVAFGWDAQDLPDPQNPETFRRSNLDW
jgi:hypothetical protein